jgi:hypothetical protein
MTGGGGSTCDYGRKTSAAYCARLVTPQDTIELPLGKGVFCARNVRSACRCAQ